MSVSAKFTADFTQFTAAAKTAEQSLKGVEDQSEQLGKTGSRVAGLLGSTFGQAFAGFTAANVLSSAVSTLTSLATEAFKSAEAIVNLSNATGASIETVQRWSYVAKAAGEDVKLFADAAFKLGTTLAGGGNSVEAAVQALGLSFQVVARMSPEQQFDTIATALSEMEAGSDRNTIALTLFGRQASTLLPAIGDNYAELSQSATVSTDEQVKALNEAVQEWNKFKTLTKGVADSVFANVVLFLRDAYKQITFAPIGKDIELVAEAAKAAGPSLKETADAMAEADRHAKEFAKANQAIVESMAGASGLNGAVEQAIRYYLELGVSQQTLATYYGEAPAAIAAVAAAMRDEEAAAKERQATLQVQIDATARMIESVKGPAGLTPAIRENVTRWHELGASLKDIQGAFNLTDGQVKQLTSDMDAAAAKTKALTDQTNAYVLENLKARQAIEAARGGAGGGSLFSQYEQDVEAIRQEQAGPGGGVIDFASRQEALWLKLQEDIAKTTAETNNLTGALETQATMGRQTGLSFEQLTTKARELGDAFRGTVQAGMQLPTGIPTHGGRVLDLFGRPVTTPGTMINLPKFETGFEQRIPYTNIVINGSVLSDKDEIARVVGDAITQSYAKGGRRLPV